MVSFAFGIVITYQPFTVANIYYRDLDSVRRVLCLRNTPHLDFYYFIFLDFLGVNDESSRHIVGIIYQLLKNAKAYVGAAARAEADFDG